MSPSYHYETMVYTLYMQLNRKKLIRGRGGNQRQYVVLTGAILVKTSVGRLERREVCLELKLCALFR